MNSINIQNTTSILVRALNSIDSRLVNHGYRVAYIVYKMMQAAGDYSSKEMRELIILATLHDIGAYKTEEIDRMVEFESKDTWEHSIYGYLFLKNMSPLREFAEVILYHHLDYNKKKDPQSKIMRLADIFNLADRVDVIFEGTNRSVDIKSLERYRDKKFDSATIDLFVKAYETYELEEKLKSLTYLNELFDELCLLDYDEETLIDYIRMIAYSIDFRSEFTVTHVITTVGISLELGQLLGLDEKQLKTLLLGAYLHDIGKVATPLDILEKPGALTKEEYQIMKMHIEETNNIIRNALGNEILQIAYRHHEKIDGSGYPKGLENDQLTLSERIVAIADIMSALTGKRSYKEKLGKDAVTSILKAQRDKGELCPIVVDLAIENYDVIMKKIEIKSQEVEAMYQNIKKDYKSILGEVKNVY